MVTCVTTFEPIKCDTLSLVNFRVRFSIDGADARQEASETDLDCERVAEPNLQRSGSRVFALRVERFVTKHSPIGSYQECHNSVVHISIIICSKINQNLL